MTTSSPSPGPVAAALLWLVVGYSRWVSPLLGPHCRFAPTCSAYAAQALRIHGAARGSWLTVRRLSRCQPFCPGGHDPVPPARRPSVAAPAPATAVASDPSRAASARPDAPEQTCA